MTIWQTIRKHMMQYPSQVVEDASGSMRYSELVAFVDAFSEKLSGETCCAIYCKAERTTAELLLCCLAAGVPMIPLSLQHDLDRCAAILEKYRPSCMVTDLYGTLGVYHVFDCMGEHPFSVTLFEREDGRICDIPVTEAALQEFLRRAENVMPPREVTVIETPLCEKAVFFGQFLDSLLRGSRIFFRLQGARTTARVAAPEDEPQYRCSEGGYTAAFYGGAGCGKVLSLKKSRVTIICFVEGKVPVPQVQKLKQREDVLHEYILFRDVFPDADLWYCADSGGLRQGINIKKQAASDAYHYTFMIAYTNAIWVYLAKERELVFFDSLTCGVVCSLKLPGMRDSCGSESNGVDCEVQTVSDRMLQLVVTADAAWINSPNRVFPIHIS